MPPSNSRGWPVSYDVGVAIFSFALSAICGGITIGGAFWKVSRTYVTKEEHDKRCASVDERLDRVNARCDAIEDKQHQQELSYAELKPVIKGLQEAVQELTGYLRGMPCHPHCTVATDVPPKRKGGGRR